jgi:hypothetical protein
MTNTNPLARTVSMMRLDPEVERKTLFEWVPIEKMFVAGYGRPLDQARVSRLRQHWNPDAVGMVFLSLRDDGRYAVLDGHHRASAARAQGMTMLPARVYIDLTYAQEAELFLSFANNKQQSALDRFRARVEAREPAAADILRIVRGQGLKIQPSAGNRQRSKLRAISAVAALDEVYVKHGGAPMLQEVLRLLDTAYPNDSLGLSGSFLVGLAMFLRRYQDNPDYDEHRLTTVLHRAGADEVLLQAKQLKKITLTMTNACYGQAMRNLYNRGLKTRHLPEWVERTEQRESTAQRSQGVRQSHRNRRELEAGGGIRPLPQDERSV